MRAVGLTGGIASGKSTVLQFFSEWGASVIDSDVVAKRCSQPGTEGQAEIVRAFGLDLLLPSGELDRRRLSEIVFLDPKKKKTLEKILHPRIMAHILVELEKARRLGTRVLIVEVPLLFEAGAEGSFQRTIAVVSSPTLQRERLRRRGLEEPWIDRWLQNQWPEEEKAARADFLIRNEGDLQQLRQRSRAVFEEIAAEAEDEADCHLT